MNKKIARITQDKKLLLANEIVEDNRYSLNEHGKLYTKNILEGNKFSIDDEFIEVGEFIEGYPFVKPVIDDSLVLWLDGSTGNNYEQTGTWKDLSGNGNDGQLRNFGYTEDSGWVDGGLRFDGVDDYVDCGNGDSLNITEDLTIEMVVKINPGDNVGGICKGDLGRWVSNPYGIRSNTSTNKNSYYFFISDGANLNKVLIPNIDNGSWLHIVGTTSKAEMNLKTYRNGVFEGTSERSIDNILINYNSLEVGTYYAKARTRGVFKLVRIYNRALTDEEILQNYQAGQCSPLLAMRGDV